MQTRPLTQPRRGMIIHAPFEEGSTNGNYGTVTKVRPDGFDYHVHNGDYDVTVGPNGSLAVESGGPIRNSGFFEILSLTAEEAHLTYLAGVRGVSALIDTETVELDQVIGHLPEEYRPEEVRLEEHAIAFIREAGLDKHFAGWLLKKEQAEPDLEDETCDPAF
ncbi:hypothetical protein [Defluviimonas salinarum]|uniref:Uncharacterized protein n=1 Tax=Defluviimonas salinarum TaxID=2992147 RepID=A0ABT3J695_9RHOB|nr:hypothetical protein [Defluviimonas salinarum]MCW3782919.1 hypothetical protein [Defluviimonas salinarum]